MMNKHYKTIQNILYSESTPHKNEEYSVFDKDMTMKLMQYVAVNVCRNVHNQDI